MKKRTISKLKSIFGSKKGKRHHQQDSQKPSRECTPEPAQEPAEFRPVQHSPQPAQPRPPPSPPVPTNPIAPVPPEPSGPLSLNPCPVCGRTFNPQSLAKHVTICQKMTIKKRKLFDSSRQRREGTDLEQFLPKNFGLPENSPFLEKSPPPTAKPVVHKAKITTTVTTGGKSFTTKSNPDLQRCPHCNRAFGVRAFERHVEWCADKAKILPAAQAQAPPHIADAKQRLNARTQYKAPLARGRRKSSQSRDKSHSRSGSVESSRGVSPPRDYGDYNKYARPRASESMSSSEYQEDTAHVPVIRQGRHAHGPVDASVKARQARLARDLSSSRQSQEPNSRSQKPEVKNENNYRKESSKTKDRNERPKDISEEDESYEPIEKQENTHKKNNLLKGKDHSRQNKNKTKLHHDGNNKQEKYETHRTFEESDEMYEKIEQESYAPSLSPNEYSLSHESNFFRKDNPQANYVNYDRNERAWPNSPITESDYTKNEMNDNVERRKNKRISREDDEILEKIEQEFYEPPGLPNEYNLRNENNYSREDRSKTNNVNCDRNEMARQHSTHHEHDYPNPKRNVKQKEAKRRENKHILQENEKIYEKIEQESYDPSLSPNEYSPSHESNFSYKDKQQANYVNYDMNKRARPNSPISERDHPRNVNNDNVERLKNKRISREDVEIHEKIEQEIYEPPCLQNEYNLQNENNYSREDRSTTNNVYYDINEMAQQHSTHHERNYPNPKRNLRRKEAKTRDNKHVLEEDDKNNEKIGQESYELPPNDYNLPNGSNFSRKETNKTYYTDSDRNERAPSPGDEYYYPFPKRIERNDRQESRENKRMSEDVELYESSKDQESSGPHLSLNNNVPRFMRSERRHHIDNDSTAVRKDCHCPPSKVLREPSSPPKEYYNEPPEKNECRKLRNNNRSSSGQRSHDSSGILSPCNDFDYPLRANNNRASKDDSSHYKPKNRHESPLEQNKFDYPSTKRNKHKQQKDIDKSSPRNEFDNKARDTAEGTPRSRDSKSLRDENYYPPSEKGDYNPLARNLQKNDCSSIKDKSDISDRLRKSSPINAPNIQSSKMTCGQYQPDVTYTAQYDKDYNCIGIRKNTLPHSSPVEHKFLPLERDENGYSTKIICTKHQLPLQRDDSSQSYDVNYPCTERGSNHSSSARDNYNSSFVKNSNVYPTQRKRRNEIYNSSVPVNDLENLPSVNYEKKGPSQNIEKHNDPEKYDDDYPSSTETSKLKLDNDKESYPAQDNREKVINTQYNYNKPSPRKSKMSHSPSLPGDINNPSAIDKIKVPYLLPEEYDKASAARTRRSHLPVRRGNIQTFANKEDENGNSTPEEVERQESTSKKDCKPSSNPVRSTRSLTPTRISPEIGFQRNEPSLNLTNNDNLPLEMIEIESSPGKNDAGALVRLKNDTVENKGNITLPKQVEGDCETADPKLEILHSIEEENNNPPSVESGVSNISFLTIKVREKTVTFDDDEQNVDNAEHSKKPPIEIADKEAFSCVSTNLENHNSNVVKNKPKLTSDKASFTKDEKYKLKTKLGFKKEQKLKKLEDIVQKYEERTRKLEEQERLDEEKLNKKSLIPVSKTKCKQDKHVSNTYNEKLSNKNTNTSSVKANSGSSSCHSKGAAMQSSRKQTPKPQTRISKESSMSLDSLENEKNQEAKSINAELLCPCVPCIIHRPDEQKLLNKKSAKSSKMEITLGIGVDVQPKLEVLYKNESLTTSSVASIATNNQTLNNTLSMKSVTTKITDISDTPNRTSVSNSLSDNSINDDITKKCNGDNCVVTISSNTVRTENTKQYEESTSVNKNQTTEIFQESYKQDNVDEYLENNIAKNHKEETNEQNISPQGSCDTYTKFSTNFDDLDEFLSITDKMMTDEHKKTKELGMEENINTLHTPKSMNVSLKTSELPTDKNEGHHFSDAFEDLKCNLKELLNDNRDKFAPINNTQNIIEMDQVTDLKRSSKCQLQFNDTRQDMQKNKNEKSELKLPSINYSNKPERKTACTQKEVQNIYKPNRRYKTVEKHETYRPDENEVENSDFQPISNDEPPLKLPRIEKTGLDDNYDPFASAARQMKELMSSETNLSKKIIESYKDTNRTLPILRPKEKTNLSTLRSDNTKLIKDSLNKSYQKTPTLQRLKSFGGSNNENQNSSFGGRCSSFRINRQISNDKKSSQPKLNTTFTKSSKENILTPEKNYFNRNSSLNRSFSSYTASSYSTPKPKDKVPKITSSMSHSFQRTTIKQPVKLDKIKKDVEKKDFVNLDSILADSHISDNSSMTDSNYIDPRLINENDNLPINVNTILNNPDIISSMESLLTQHKEILPTKFESFSSTNLQNNNNKECDDVQPPLLKLDNIKKDNINNNNSNNKLITPLIDDLSFQYDKIMSSLEQSIGSKTSIRDDDSLCEDFDLEEFMTSFDDEVNKQKLENKRTCSSTTRVVKPADLEISHDNKISEIKDSSSPKVVCNGSNGIVPVNKSMSLNFSTNNIVSENLFPHSMKRSNSLIDTMQRKPHKSESAMSRHKNEHLEQEIINSLKEIDKYYEEKCLQHIQSSKERIHDAVLNGTPKRESRGKSEKKSKKSDNISNGNYTPNGKSSDSAYSSLNRISPSKLSVCNSKVSNGVSSLEQIPAESDSSGCQKDDVRSVSSEEFLAMERSAELVDTGSKTETQHMVYKETDNHEKRTSSRTSSRQSAKWQAPRVELSSSGSEASLPRPRRGSAAPSPPTTLRLSRFCHECGSKFPVDTAKFCIECGVKRLLV